MMLSTFTFESSHAQKITNRNEDKIRAALVARDVVQAGNIFQAKFNIPEETSLKMMSQEYIINKVAFFQILATGNLDSCHSSSWHSFILIRFKKIQVNDNLNYSIVLTSSLLQLSEVKFQDDDGHFRQIGEISYQNKNHILDINIQMEITSKQDTFADLCNDDEMTDFEMHGEDGLIHVHKAVLASASPVLKRMLCCKRKWKEAEKGMIKVSGSSKQTLQSLKNYVYCNILPDTGLEQLLLLASCYMMPVLEQKCIDKLVKGLSAEQVFDLMEFAVKNQMRKLMLALFDLMYTKMINVNDLREFVMKGEVGDTLLSTKNDDE